jgi:hypothetical protein
LHLVHLPGTPHTEGTVSVLSAAPATCQWHEFIRATTIDQVQHVLAALEALGLPGRAPNVKGVVDTSEGWERLVFWVQVKGESRTVNLDVHSSGFDGPDAEPLRTLFRRLFALAGFTGFSPVIYGERRTAR